MSGAALLTLTIARALSNAEKRRVSTRDCQLVEVGLSTSRRGNGFRIRVADETSYRVAAYRSSRRAAGGEGAKGRARGDDRGRRRCEGGPGQHAKGNIDGPENPSTDRDRA